MIFFQIFSCFHYFDSSSLFVMPSLTNNCIFLLEKNKNPCNVLYTIERGWVRFRIILFLPGSAWEMKNWYLNYTPIVFVAYHVENKNRKLLANVAGMRLFYISSRTIAQGLEIVGYFLSLIEEAIFHIQQTQHARMLLKKTAFQQRSNYSHFR